MGRARDPFTADLFSIPAPAASAPGSVNFGREIAARMSARIKKCPHDRIEIAARMSRLLGEEITVAMLDSWTAASKEEHIPNLNRCIAFDIASEGAANEEPTLADFHASKLGGRVMFGPDALLAELGRLEREEQEIRTRKRALKYLVRGKR